MDWFWLIFKIYIVLHIICSFLAWGLYIARIRKLCPNGVFCLPGEETKFKKKAYDSAIVRALIGPYSVWYSFKHEDGFKNGFKLT